MPNQDVGFPPPVPVVQDLFARIHNSYELLKTCTRGKEPAGAYLLVRPTRNSSCLMHEVNNFKVVVWKILAIFLWHDAILTVARAQGISEVHLLRRLAECWDRNTSTQSFSNRCNSFSQNNRSMGSFCACSPGPSGNMQDAMPSSGIRASQSG